MQLQAYIHLITHTPPRENANSRTDRQPNMPTCLHANIQLHIRAGTHAYIEAAATIYTHTHIHHTHTYIHTYIHTYREALYTFRENTQTYIRASRESYTHTYIHTGRYTD